MMKIWKYQIIGSDCEIEIPNGSKILSLQAQVGIPCIWVLVDPDASLITRRFITYVTGSFADVLPTEKYIGTYQVGWFVGHIFERIVIQ